MRTELEPAWYLDRVYRVADSIDSRRVYTTQDCRVSTKDRQVSRSRSVFDALKAPALRDLTQKRSVHCGFIKLLF